MQQWRRSACGVSDFAVVETGEVGGWDCHVNEAGLKALSHSWRRSGVAPSRPTAIQMSGLAANRLIRPKSGPQQLTVTLPLTVCSHSAPTGENYVSAASACGARMPLLVARNWKNLRKLTRSASASGPSQTLRFTHRRNPLLTIPRVTSSRRSTSV